MDEITEINQGIKLAKEKVMQAKNLKEMLEDFNQELFDADASREFGTAYLRRMMTKWEDL